MYTLLPITFGFRIEKPLFVLKVPATVPSDSNILTRETVLSQAVKYNFSLNSKKFPILPLELPVLKSIPKYFVPSVVPSVVQSSFPKSVPLVLVPVSSSA
jgi:hypothetical protein